MLSARSPVDHGHRIASCDTSLVLSGGVDCGRTWRNAYDKKPQRYFKDNRTAHLTARSDKSVAYVTNNKRIYSTFCTVEANYWPTRSIARPLCDSRATCLLLLLQLLQALDADSSARNMQLANRFREIDDAIGDNVDNVTRVITWPAKPPDSQPSISLYWVLWLD